MSSWKTLSSEEVYQTPWIRVRRDEVLNHKGKRLTYGVVELMRPSVFIIATNAAGQICLIQNYRYSLDRIMWEVPAGYADESDMLAAAQRELREETGLAGDDWTNLGMLYQATGIGKIPFTAFLARGVRPVTDERDPDEDISEQRFVDLDTLETMIKEGEIVESSVLAGLYLAKLHGLQKGEN